MSKNIYRVNKKSDLDEIMKNNFLKPVCIIFVSKSSNTELYNDITKSVLVISKQHTYNMVVVIDFDDFLDNNNFFEGIKSNTPYFLAFFKGKNIASVENNENFIPIIINKMEEIHQSYVGKLATVFNQNQEQSQSQEINLKSNQDNIDNKEKHSNLENENEDGNEGKDEEENEEYEEGNEKDEEGNEENEEQDEEVDENNDEDEKKSSRSLMSNDSEKIRKEKEKLKKLKELQKLQSMLKK